MTFGGWAVSLNGVALVHACGDSQELWDALDCFPMTVLDAMDAPPEGLDLPDLRTEDVTYYQRDGVKHFSDWYEPRFVTIVGTIGPFTDADCADPCLTTRQLVVELGQAWKRQADTELVVYPPCAPSDDPLERIYTGPYGIVGRPRQFKGRYVNRDETIYEFVARFDSVDQRMYVLDECGTPGYTNCVEIDPGVELFALCGTDGTGIYAGSKVVCGNAEGLLCADTPVVSDDSVLPTLVEVGGTEQVYPEIVLYPPLPRPYVQNYTTGEYVQLDAVLTDSDSPVTINTEEGTAFDSDGNSLTHLLRGSLFMTLYPGNYNFRLLAAGEDVEGYATLCWRDTVVMG